MSERVRACEGGSVVTLPLSHARTLQRAFTLLEVLISLAILALAIAAIGVATSVVL